MRQAWLALRDQEVLKGWQFGKTVSLPRPDAEVCMVEGQEGLCRRRDVRRGLWHHHAQALCVVLGSAAKKGRRRCIPAARASELLFVVLLEGARQSRALPDERVRKRHELGPCQSRGLHFTVSA